MTMMVSIAWDIRAMAVMVPIPRDVSAVTVMIDSIQIDRPFPSFPVSYVQALMRVWATALINF
ncbi:hypothetical protein HFA01_04750 [Halobacillus faecis]|uniref:Uncharacterized protein n=1 Tax=Halobacillus faecis TaxID=360184 RepID=A0A511WPQ2_9BACI|nr:hypothetical protein HFA01_04750 [Halobacillus faecis]